MFAMLGGFYAAVNTEIKKILFVINEIALEPVWSAPVPPKRTRNQTTLSNLAKMLASLNGEFAFCMGLLEAGELETADAARLQKHVSVLETKRAALRLTLLQFDPNLDVGSIKGLDTWRKRLGSRRLSGAKLHTRILAELRAVVRRECGVECSFKTGW